MFKFLDRIFDKLLTLWPRRVILGPHEGGVRFTWIPFYGLHIKEVTNGWFVVWPIIQRMDWIEIKTQTVDLRCQSVLTKDLKDVTVGGAIRYYIKVPCKAILEVQDYDKNIETIALGVIHDFVSRRTIEELSDDNEELKTEILLGIRQEALEWGLKVQKIYITDLGRARNIRLLTQEGNQLREFTDA